MPVPLFCDDHGWHPGLREVMDRLADLGGGVSDAGYRDLLVREAGAMDCGCGGHLVGSLTTAIEVMRSFESKKLSTLYSLPPG